jgi:NADPH2:quinone reductase
VRAVVISRFGGPEVLEPTEVSDPVPGPHEVRIALHAAAVNPVDADNRADGAWGNVHLPAIIGSDFSGVIDAVGAAVGDWRPGDEVFGAAPFRAGEQGTYAEFLVADPETIARKPANLSHVEAAAVPVAGGTAHTVINRRLRIESGERVLIHGAGGGVGVFAVQLVAAAGAEAIALASRRHHELLRQLGATVAIDYRERDALATAQQRAGGEFDAVADLVGGTSVVSSLASIREGGRAATIVDLKGDFDLALDRNITLHGVLLDRTDSSLFDELRAAIEAGQLRPVVSTVLPLEQAAEAHRLLEAGHVQGKIVLAIRT